MGIYGPEFAEIYDRDWSQWREHVWPFLERTVGDRCPGATTWLDACCGTGALLARLVELGYRAVGFDLSPHQLAHARRNAPGAEIVQADVREVDLGRTFDVVTCLFDSLNYLTDPADLARALGRLVAHLEPGGVLIFDMNTYEGLQDAWNRTSALRDPDHVLIIETSFDEATAIGRGRITGFLREGELYRKFDEEHIERGYRAEEIERILAGLTLEVSTCDGYTLEQPEPRSGRLMYVCTRPATHGAR